MGTRFTTYNAPTGIAVGSSGVAATAEDFGPAQGLISLGDSGIKASNIIRQREDKRSITQARAGFADLRLQFEQEQTVREQNAPIGAAGFVEETSLRYKETVNKFTSGLNGVQLNALGDEMASSRLSTMRSAVRFKSGQMVKADLMDIGKIQASIVNSLIKGDTNYAEATEKFVSNVADTTINAVGQKTIVTAALPVFRKAIATGLLQTPLHGLTQLKEGKLDFLPEEERIQLKKDLRDKIKGMDDERELDQLVALSQNNVAAFELLTKPNPTTKDLQILENLKSSLDSGVYNNIKRTLIKKSKPKRSIEEMNTAQTDVASRFIELEIVKKGTTFKTTKNIKKLVDFQNYLTTLVTEGFIGAGTANRYSSKIEEIVQNKINESGTGYFIYNDEPYRVAIDSILQFTDSNKLGTNVSSNLLRTVLPLIDNDPIANSTERTPERDKRIQEIVASVIDQDARNRIPSVRHLKEVPNGVVNTNGGVTSGSPGENKSKPDKTISGPKIYKDKNGNYARVTQDAIGKVIDVEPITEAEALKTEPTVPETNLPTDSMPKPATKKEPNRLPDGRTGVSVDLDPPFGGKTTDTVTSSGNRSKVSVDLDPPFGGKTTDIAISGGTSVSIDLDIPPSEQAINIVTNQLVANEGTGDFITGIPTGEGGITEARKRDIEKRKGRPLTDAQARNEAVREDSATLHNRLPGFDLLGAKVQAALVDLTYNIGVNKVLDPSLFPKLQQAIAEGDVQAILFSTLDTAIIDKKSVKGLARRRARMFNQANTNPKFNITKVEQLNDGTINYLSGNKVIYTFKRPKHKDSKAGLELITAKET
tara:strand:- start:5057 stop:7519 length:2463 start_codon:yes stop_codon:yes gene_type:complete